MFGLSGKHWLIVNNLPLPRDLIALMAAGRWHVPHDPSGVNRLFPENGGLCLYSLRSMEFETQTCFRHDMQIPMWQGAPDPENPPGDIQPQHTVFVGDIGIGFDQPIALDYRESRDRPRVLTLQWQWSQRGNHNRWIEIASDILAFAEVVGL
jgi:hypothetical protein